MKDCKKNEIRFPLGSDFVFSRGPYQNWTFHITFSTLAIVAAMPIYGMTSLIRMK